MPRTASRIRGSGSGISGLTLNPEPLTRTLTFSSGVEPYQGEQIRVRGVTLLVAYSESRDAD